MAKRAEHCRHNACTKGCGALLDEPTPSDSRDILAARVKRLKAELAQALEALGHASIDKRPLTEREKAFGQWLIDKLSLYSEDSEEGPCPDL